MNWSTVKFRASSWGDLLVEPREKGAKERGELSVTCQKALIRIYNEVKYGRKKDLVTKQMEKGTICEPEGIAMFGEVEGKEFHKNIFRLENEWFCGHPDIYVGENIIETEECHEIKCSWELDSFMPKLFEEVDKGYEAQLNVYFDLLGEQCRTGSITYCLVSAPENMVLDEQRRLLYTMDVVSEDNPDFKIAAAEVAKNMVFEDIPIQERVIKKPVTRNDELIAKMKAKVPILREWLCEFEKKHLSQFKKIKCEETS